MKQDSLFPLTPKPVQQWCCSHGVPINWKPGECPKCEAEMGDEPKGKP